MEFKITRDGNNILVYGVPNGGRIPLDQLGITESSEIKLLWTVLDEADLFIGFDSETGAKIQRPLKDVKPRHHKNAFLEDRMHDWFIHQGELRYGAHSSEVGETVTILIELKPKL